MKRIMLYTAVVLATLAVLVILWQFRLVVLLFLLSLFAAATIRPVVDKLRESGVSTVVATLLLYLIGIGGLLLILLLIGGLLLEEVNVAANQAVIEYEALHRRWQEGAAWQQFAAAELFPLPYDPDLESETDFVEMLPSILNITVGLASTIGGLLIVMAMSVYWSGDQNRFERLWLSILPVTRRRVARNSWREIERNIGSYLRNHFVQSMLIALFLGVGGLVAGIDFPLLLALFGALAVFVPYLGGVVTTVVAFTLGSLQSIGFGIGAAVYTIILFSILEFWVKPKLWPRERRNFLLTFLVLLPLLETFGIWGLIAAPPLALAIEVIVRQAYGFAVGKKQSDIQLDQLEARYRQLSNKIAEADPDDLTPELRNMSNRLADLLDISGKESFT